jgi:nucleoside-triphosphatase THEP1
LWIKKNPCIETSYGINNYGVIVSCGKKIVVITGEKNIGKTTFIKKLYTALLKLDLEVNGFREIKTCDLLNYEIENLKTGERFLWAQRNQNSTNLLNSFKTKYNYNTSNLDNILNSLKKNVLESKEKDIFIFDEFGKIEIKGSGLLKIFEFFFKKYNCLIIVVQKSVLQEFSNKYNEDFSQKLLIELDLDRLNNVNGTINEVNAFLSCNR